MIFRTAVFCSVAALRRPPGTIFLWFSLFKIMFLRVLGRSGPVLAGEDELKRAPNQSQAPQKKPQTGPKGHRRAHKRVQ